MSAHHSKQPTYEGVREDVAGTQEARHRRRAVMAMFTAVLVPLLLVMAAITIDLGAMMNARADLQDAADSAAMAGVSAFTSDAMMSVRMGSNVSTSLADVLNWTSDRSSSFSLLNPTFGAAGTQVAQGDIVPGWLDLVSDTSSVVPNPAPATYNAVRVTVQRAADGANGPVNFFFASIFGQHTGETTATATAVFDDRVAGFDPEKGNLMPFTIDKDEYERQFLEGDDAFEYDPGTGYISPGNDGVREINLYPYDMAPGNFGLLNIGTENEGNPGLQDHIENGVSAADMELETGSPILTFYDDEGTPETYDITGDPGIKSTLESSVETKIGQVVAFLLHDQVTEGGSNSVYRITSIRFARVMEVELQTNSSGRGLWLQPVTYSGPALVFSRTAPSSGGAGGRIVLAR